jgi:hypothetical protein
MKTFKFLTGTLLFILLLCSMGFTLYYPIKTIMILIPQQIRDNYTAFFVLLAYSPFIAFIIGFVSYPINEWYKRKCKEIK